MRRTLIALLFLSSPLLAQAPNGWSPIENGWAEIQVTAPTGTVTTTGTLASGQVALGSGATSITGDAGLTYSGTGATFRLFNGAGSAAFPSFSFDGFPTYGMSLTTGTTLSHAGVGVLRTMTDGVTLTNAAVQTVSLTVPSAGLLLVEDGSGSARDVQARTVTASNHIISVGRFTENYGNGGLFLYGGAGSAIVGWSSALGTLNTPDVALSRASAGTLLVEDGSGAARDVRARTVTVFGTSSPGVEPFGAYINGSPAIGISTGGHLYGSATNTRDIGIVGNEFRTGYFGTSVVTPVVSGGTTTTTLTESSATSFATLTFAASTVAGVEMLCRVRANDATDFQVLTSRIRISTVRKATGNTVSAIGVVGTDLLAESAGGSTLTCTYTVVEGASAATVQASCVSSLTQTTLNLSFLAETVGPVAVAQL